MFFDDLLKPLTRTEAVMTPPSLEVGWVREVNAAARTVKLELESIPGLLTDWVPIMQAMAGVDAPIYSKGTKVVVGHFSCDTTRMIVLGTVLGEDHPNTLLETDSPSEDLAQNVYGDQQIAVVGSHSIITGDGMHLQSESSNIHAIAPTEIKLTSSSTEIEISPIGIKLKTASGGLFLHPGGGITFLGRSRGFTSSLSSDGQQYGNPDMFLGADGTLTIQASNVEVNAGAFTWNGRRVIVVGDRDTRGGVNV